MFSTQEMNYECTDACISNVVTRRDYESALSRQGNAEGCSLQCIGTERTLQGIDTGLTRQGIDTASTRQGIDMVTTRQDIDPVLTRPGVHTAM